jgi:membrane-associated phospholipid phosphatase
LWCHGHVLDGHSLLQGIFTSDSGSNHLAACCRFALIASNIPVSSTLNPLQAVPESASSQSALQQLLANSGSAAQAATLQAAGSAQDAVQPVLSNPILQLDEAIHQYVATHTTEAFRLMADVWISDGFIIAGVLGWLACTAVCLVKAPVKSAGALAAAWGFYFATCGAVGHGDPLLVDALKHLFARARPSTLHHTFSFPSGHTSAAVFTVGALLTVLLPLTLQLWAESTRPASSTTDGDNSSSTEPLGSPSAAGMLPLDVTILGVWAAAWGTTATGRILSESHWLSDTMAGGMLAVASVSGLALTVSMMEAVDAAGPQQG